MRGIEGLIPKMLNIVQHSTVGTVIFYIRSTYLLKLNFSIVFKKHTLLMDFDSEFFKMQNDTYIIKNANNNYFLFRFTKFEGHFAQISNSYFTKFSQNSRKIREIKNCAKFSRKHADENFRSHANYFRPIRNKTSIFNIKVYKIS